VYLCVWKFGISISRPRAEMPHVPMPPLPPPIQLAQGFLLQLYVLLSNNDVEISVYSTRDGSQKHTDAERRMYYVLSG